MAEELDEAFVDDARGFVEGAEVVGEAVIKRGVLKVFWRDFKKFTYVNIHILSFKIICEFVFHQKIRK